MNDKSKKYLIRVSVHAIIALIIYVIFGFEITVLVTLITIAAQTDG